MHRPDTSPIMGEVGRGWCNSLDAAAGNSKSARLELPSYWPPPPGLPTKGAVPLGAWGGIQPAMSKVDARAA